MKKLSIFTLVLILCVVQSNISPEQLSSEGNQALQEMNKIESLHSSKHNAQLFKDIPSDIVGGIAYGILIAFCNVAGIGGGGINVSICIILFGLSTKQSLAISSFCILCGALVRFILNFNETHPFKHATSIDYSVVMLMFPMFLLGSVIGIKASIAVPDLLLTALTTVVLALLSIHTIVTAVRLRAKDIETHNQRNDFVLSCSSNFMYSADKIYDRSQFPS